MNDYGVETNPHDASQPSKFSREHWDLNILRLRIWTKNLNLTEELGCWNWHTFSNFHFHSAVPNVFGFHEEDPETEEEVENTNLNAGQTLKEINPSHNVEFSKKKNLFQTPRFIHNLQLNHCCLRTHLEALKMLSKKRKFANHPIMKLAILNILNSTQPKLKQIKRSCIIFPNHHLRMHSEMEIILMLSEFQSEEKASKC